MLVTGASKGIGRTIAARLAADGHRVVGTYRSGDVPEGVVGVQADITDAEQIEAAFAAAEQAHGAVEVLVCNAGITADTLLMRMSDEQWDRVLATNYDKLTLTIETDGTVDADEAIRQSAKILIDHFSLLTGLAAGEEAPAKAEASEEEETEEETEEDSETSADGEEKPKKKKASKKK